MSTFTATHSTPTVTRDGTTGLITVHPLHDSNHSATVVFCHGLGDSGEGWVDVAETLVRTVVPHCKFLLPTAPIRPVTLNGGMRMNAWYDLTGLTDRAAESCDGIDASCDTLRALLASEHALGVRYDRMVLAGFSQGGALSLFAGLQMPSAAERLAGVLVLSGYLPGAGKFRITDGLHGTPVLHAHGEADPVVMLEWAKKTHEHVAGEKGGTAYELRTHPNVGHTVSPGMLAQAQAFLQRVLPDAPDLACKPKAPADMSVKELKEAVKRAGLAARAVGFSEKREFVALLEEHRKEQG